MSNSADSQKRQLELGRFGKVHGIKGWLRLNSFTDPAENICEYGALLATIDQSWVALEIDEFRVQAKGLVVHVKGYDDPETARQLTGKSLWIDSDVMPVLADGEYYWHQLENLKVINQKGEVFGVVEGLMETGANDVLVVKPGPDSIDDRERLIPYLMGSVIESIDLDAAIIKVNWEADYLE